MDIEGLTKSQIVLLTLLVSFVTSIATGIVTVSLMDQAPQAITQTINRVVERTVERVVPTETQTATVITKEKTVVVKESELVAQAVSRIEPSFVRVYVVSGEKKTPVAVGVAVSSGLIATDGSAVFVDGTYEVELSNGNMVSAKVEGKAPDGKPALLSLVSKEAGVDVPKMTSAALSTDAMRLGQSIVALSGLSTLKIASGLVTGFVSTDDSGTAEVSGGNATGADAPVIVKPRQFETSFSATSLSPGSVITNTDGAVVGMFVGGVFVTSSMLTDLFTAQEEGSTSS